MDYFEGLFLGKLWSDTDFENRRHVALFILYGLFVDGLVLLTYWTGKKLPIVGTWGTLQMVILIILFLACPFICFRYYRMPLWGKILVLIEKFIKHLLIISFSISVFIPYLSVEVGDLQEFFVDYLNKTLEVYTEKYYETAGTFATILGVVSGGMHVVLVFAFWAVAAVVVPGLLYLVYRMIQYGYDWVIAKLVIRKFFIKRKPTKPTK